MAKSLQILILSASLFATGCVSWQPNSLRTLARVASFGGDSAVSVRKTPENPLSDSLNLVGWGGPQPTERTEQLLRRLNLDEAHDIASEEVLVDLRQRHLDEPSLEKLHALAELAYIQAERAKRRRSHEVAQNYYGATICYAYEYLFDTRFDRVRNTFDPEFRDACDLYNAALEGLLRRLKDEGRLRPGATESLSFCGRELEFAITINGPWHGEDFEQFEFASDYKVKGLNNVYHTYGLGVPLIALRKSHQGESKEESYYPPGLTFAVTAFFRTLPTRHLSAEVAQKSSEYCAIELIDPLRETHIGVDGRTIPLESDITTPLAYYLDDPLVSTNTIATLSLLNANFGENFRGLYMLEPYDPNRIPVVMVHGLWSSPVTWMEMFNDLRALPEIRDNYQFWFYMYPTGQPFWISAEQMREDLAIAEGVLDPRRESSALREMVLVGHSMGGLVAKLQTIHSDDDFWNIMSDQSFAELEATEQTKQQLADIWFFEPNPSIRRVVTIGTPHRGSEFANSTTRWLSHKLFRLPDFITGPSQRVIRGNPDYFHDTNLLTITTSIDSLSPESPILPVMLEAELDPRVIHHNIVGRESSKGLLERIGVNLQGEGDGVVSLVSATVETAASQIEIDAAHTELHQHPRAILEVRRILLEHLARVRGDRIWDPSIVPAQHQSPANDQYSPSSHEGESTSHAVFQEPAMKDDRDHERGVAAGHSRIPHDSTTATPNNEPAIESIDRLEPRGDFDRSLDADTGVSVVQGSVLARPSANLPDQRFDPPILDPPPFGPQPSPSSLMQNEPQPGFQHEPVELLTNEAPNGNSPVRPHSFQLPPITSVDAASRQHLRSRRQLNSRPQPNTQPQTNVQGPQTGLQQQGVRLSDRVRLSDQR